MTKKKSSKEMPIELPQVEASAGKDSSAGGRGGMGTAETLPQYVKLISEDKRRSDYAAILLQGILSNPHVTPAAMQHKGPELAVKMADALLVELAKENT